MAKQTTPTLTVKQVRDISPRRLAQGFRFRQTSLLCWTCSGIMPCMWPGDSSRTGHKGYGAIDPTLNPITPKRHPASVPAGRWESGPAEDGAVRDPVPLLLGRWGLEKDANDTVLHNIPHTVYTCMIHKQTYIHMHVCIYILHTYVCTYQNTV